MGEQPQSAETPNLDPPKVCFRVERSWKPLNSDQDELSSVLSHRVTDALLTENLVVLCGLGTSMCIFDSEGQPKAPTMASLWSQASQQEPNFQDIVARVHFDVTSEGANIEALLSHCHLYLALQPDDAIGTFVSRTELIIRDRCAFVDDGDRLDVHRAFLLRIGRRSVKQPRMKLFTTNYDLCFERAAAEAGFVVIDGFSHTLPQRFDGTLFSYDFVRRDLEAEAPNYIPNVFHLCKLHGSIDWHRESSTSITRQSNPSDYCMIFPRVAKFELSYQQPFFELMSRFQASLRHPNTGLLIIGYGFNDNHLNEPIRAALMSNVGLKCILVSPELQDPDSAFSQNANVKSFLKLLDEGDARLLAVSSRFEDFVPIIPDLIAATDEEAHRDRMKRFN